MRTLAAWCVLAVAAMQAATISIESGPAPSDSSRAFLDQSLAIIRRFVAGTTTLAARATVIQRAPGMGAAITADCRVEFTIPDIMRKEVRGPYAYTVFVSNGTVTTTFSGTTVRDIRPLGAREDVMADFLGLCTFSNENEFNFEFAVEDNLHVVTAELRPRQLQEIASNVVAHADEAVQRKIWLDPNRRTIVKTHRVTLGHTEETCDFRGLWVNLPMPMAEE